MDLLTKLKSSLPRCLREFKTSEPEASLQTKFHLSEEFTSRKIMCKCGNDKLIVEAYKSVAIRGLFKKREEIDYWAPAFIVCSECNLRNLIFDPRQHGWDGEEGDCCSIVEKGTIGPIDADRTDVYVSYSYQNVENYEDLEGDVDKNPEDYFDMFALYVGEREKPVFEYECA